MRGKPQWAESGLPYRVGYRHSLWGKRKQVVIWVAVPDRFTGTIRPETALDDLAEWAGLAQELDSGDESFDRAFFVESDEPAFTSLFHRNASWRRQVQGLLNSDNALLKPAEFGCGNGALWLVARCRTSRIPTSTIDRIVDSLGELAAPFWAEDERPSTAPPPIATDDHCPVSIDRKPADKILAPVGIGSLAFGYLGVMFTELFYATVIEPWSIVRWLTPGVVIGLVIFAWLTFNALRNGGHAGLLLAGLLCAPVGFTATGYAVIHQANVRLDLSIGRTHTFAAGDYVTNSELYKPGRVWYYTVPDWRTDQPGPGRTVHLNRYQRGLLLPKGPVQIQVHPGALGFEWVSAITVLDGSSTPDPG